VAIVVCFVLAVLGLAMLGKVDSGIAFALCGAGGLVAVIGFLDDHGHIAARWRLLGHFTAAGWALFWLGGLPSISLFGTLVGLGWVGHVLAAIYLVWLLNLYNFMDGIDGIASVEAICVCMGGALLYAWLGDIQGALVTVLSLAAAVLGFLIWNFPPARIFMGDAGSMLIGLSVIWLLIIGTQSESASFRPVTALWIIAIPLMDMIAIMVRRIRKGQSPFQADREHLHHISLRLGLSSRESLALITSLACIFACIGIIGEYLLVPEIVMLVLFMLAFGGYLLVLQNIWRIISWFRHRRSKRF